MRYSSNRLTPHIAVADYQRTLSRGGSASLTKHSRLRAHMLRGSIFAAAVAIAACACAAPSHAPATPGVTTTTSDGAAPAPTPPESMPKPAPTPGGPLPTVVGQVTAVSSPATTPSPVAAAQVMITVDRTFDPPTVTIRRGQAIEWVNLNRSPQTVTDDPAKVAAGADAQLPAGASPIDSGVLNSGQSFIYRFDTPGTYTYTSLPGEQQGMLGRVVVN
jgi:plastocyanin